MLDWQGWGTALKPAWEPIIVARKPSEGTIAQNVLKWGTGGINVDGCRVEWQPQDLDPATNRSITPRAGLSLSTYVPGDGFLEGGISTKRVPFVERMSPAGRWPANLIHDGSDEVMAGFPDRVAGGSRANTQRGQIFVHGGEHESFGDSGSAARFFYCAKASKRDRDEGCEGMPLVERHTQGNDIVTWIDRKDGRGAVPVNARIQPRANHHPTVKPTALMRYLCRLVTPPGGIVLDPFMGSGSTGKAAVLEGFDFTGIEKDAEYCEIARARIEHAQAQAQMRLAL